MKLHHANCNLKLDLMYGLNCFVWNRNIQIIVLHEITL